MTHSLWLETIRILKHSKETTVILPFSVMDLINKHENFTLLIYLLVYAVVLCVLRLKRNDYLENEVYITSYKYSIVKTTRVDHRCKTICNHHPIPWISSLDEIQISRALPNGGNLTIIHQYCPEPNRQDNETDAWYEKVCLFSDSFKAWNSDTQCLLRGHD